MEKNDIFLNKFKEEFNNIINLYTNNFAITFIIDFNILKSRYDKFVNYREGCIYDEDFYIEINKNNKIDINYNLFDLNYKNKKIKDFPLYLINNIINNIEKTYGKCKLEKIDQLFEKYDEIIWFPFINDIHHNILTDFLFDERPYKEAIEDNFYDFIYNLITLEITKKILI